MGGGTDASFVLGFGTDLASDVMPEPVRGLTRELGHFLDPTVRVVSQQVYGEEASAAMEEVTAARRPLWYMDPKLGKAVLPQGLKPCTVEVCNLAANGQIAIIALQAALRVNCAVWPHHPRGAKKLDLDAVCHACSHRGLINYL